MSFLRSTISRKPVFVDHPGVAGKKPALADGFGDAIGSDQVTFHQGRAAGNDFAGLAQRHIVALVVDDADLGAGHRDAELAKAVADGRVQGQNTRDLGDPVTLIDAHPGHILPLGRDVGLLRHAPRAAEPEVFEHLPVEPRFRHHRREQRVDAREPCDVVFLEGRFQV